jgi:hypothetical protein
MSVENIPDSTLLSLGIKGASDFALFELGHPALASFVRPDEPAGGQFESLEQYIESGEAQIAKRSKQAPPVHHGSGSAAPVDPKKAKPEEATKLPGWAATILGILGAVAIGVALMVGLPLLIVFLTEGAVTFAAAAGYVAISVIAARFANALIERWKEGRAAGVNPMSILSAAFLDAFGFAEVEQALTNESILTGQPLNRSVGERVTGGIMGLVDIFMNAWGASEWAGRGLPRTASPDVAPPEPPAPAPEPGQAGAPADPYHGPRPLRRRPPPTRPMSWRA